MSGTLNAPVSRGTFGVRHIREDFETGLQSGVNATPTFFVNGYRHDDENTYGSLLAALERPDPY